VAESFFATLERELLNRRSFETQAQARLAVFERNLTTTEQRAVLGSKRSTKAGQAQ